jgi:hypothetical protein
MAAASEGLQTAQVAARTGISECVIVRGYVRGPDPHCAIHAQGAQLPQEILELRDLGPAPVDALEDGDIVDSKDYPAPPEPGAERSDRLDGRTEL